MEGRAASRHPYVPVGQCRSLFYKMKEKSDLVFELVEIAIALFAESYRNNTGFIVLLGHADTVELLVVICAHNQNAFFHLKSLQCVLYCISLYSGCSVLLSKKGKRGNDLVVHSLFLLGTCGYYECSINLPILSIFYYE